MKVEASYPQRLLIRLVVLFCFMALGPPMGGLMDCQAQEGARRAPSRPTAQPTASPLLLRTLITSRQFASVDQP